MLEHEVIDGEDIKRLLKGEKIEKVKKNNLAIKKVTKSAKRIRKPVSSRTSITKNTKGDKDPAKTA
ncbi:MAG: hypothetical protein L6422_06595 [Candidatus Marinimicrobia bacterium]|nr:hypothetical protein [Candidatus Neomarinimicrobiota bacterium]